MNNVVGIRKILVATDFSAFGTAAFKVAVWLARATGGSVTLLHVLPDFVNSTLLAGPSIQRGDFGYNIESFQSQAAAIAKINLRQCVAIQNAEELGIDCQVRKGPAAITIAKEAHDSNSDIVIVGCRSQSHISKMMLGSTAMRLVRKVPSAVWAANTSCHIPPRTVMCATDFSAVSRKAANLARRIAKQAGAAFHLVHVVESHDIPKGLIEQISPGHTLYDQIKSNAEQNLTQFKQSLDSNGDEIQTHILWGTPSHEIAGSIQQYKVDLLVLGTTGRTGIQKLLLGNTAESLVGSSDCSILTVKADDFQGPLFFDQHPVPAV